MISGWNWGPLIGQGAFAKVYQVREKRGGRVLACKVADIEAGMSVLGREAEILRAIGHPLFAEYVDFIQKQNCAMLFMEYVEGESLAELLEREGALPQAEAVRIAAELAEGLRYLHELPRPMLYRDLKPDNIRIRPDGGVKLLDLGCACTADEARYSRAGSRGYAAPEQMVESALYRAVPDSARSAVSPGPYSDVYALGRLLHYMLTGRNPCQPPYRKHPIRAYRPELSPLLERLAEQCTEEEPAGRPPDMRAVLRQLAPFLGQGNKLSLRIRERMAQLGWFLSGRRWEGEFYYEKCVSRFSGNGRSR